MKFNNLALPALLLFGAAGCVDLDVVNPNQPDAAIALSTAGDVESLIAGTYMQWWNSEWQLNNSMGMILSVQSFQHSAFPANFGMTQYSQFPRLALVNDPAHQFYSTWAWPWTYSYRVLSATSDGLRAIDGGRVTFTPANERRARAFARFTQGLALGQLAILYDQAFVVDEKTDITATQEAKPYMEVMEASMRYFDDAIAIASQGTFELPATWMSRAVSSAELIRLAHSYKARYRSATARTPAERQAVNWNAVIADAEAGITANWSMNMPNVAPWGIFGSGFYTQMIGFSTTGAITGLWSQVSYFMLGMADQSGRYQRWLGYELNSRDPNLGGNPADPFIIVTPDNRFPQGATLAAQQANTGRYYHVPTATGMWGQPARGSWRWSWYLNKRYEGWFRDSATNPDRLWIPLAEMNLLRAEGQLRNGNAAAAATLINISRVAAGLNATDATGTNTSCVPKLPDGSCGNLLEMLKWEKRNEHMAAGLLSAPWYFDSRGWGDLYRGTQLEFPMPCREAQVLQLQCYTFGGVGGERASAGSSYKFPGEM